MSIPPHDVQMLQREGSVLPSIPDVNSVSLSLSVSFTYVCIHVCHYLFCATSSDKFVIAKPPLTNHYVPMEMVAAT